MNCIICHGDEIVSTLVREEVKVGKNIVYVPVKVLLCKQCGEKYYDRQAMRSLAKIQNTFRYQKERFTEVGKVLAYK